MKLRIFLKELLSGQTWVSFWAKMEFVRLTFLLHEDL